MIAKPISIQDTGGKSGGRVSSATCYGDVTESEEIHSDRAAEEVSSAMRFPPH
jgi:hypothetical protein